MRLLIDIPDEQYEYIKRSDKNTFAAVSSKECMLYAIKNGTPISTDGDLISRSELKKSFEHLASDDYENPLWYESTVFRVIDNVPTVAERPQGEWIKEKTKSLEGMYRCSVCGRRVEDLSDDVRIHAGCENYTISDIYPFCHCGADMRKGGAE